MGLAKKAARKVVDHATDPHKLRRDERRGRTRSVHREGTMPARNARRQAKNNRSR